MIGWTVCLSVYRGLTSTNQINKWYSWRAKLLRNPVGRGVKTCFCVWEAVSAVLYSSTMKTYAAVLNNKKHQTLLLWFNGAFFWFAFFDCDRWDESIQNVLFSCQFPSTSRLLFDCCLHLWSQRWSLVLSRKGGSRKQQTAGAPDSRVFFIKSPGDNKNCRVSVKCFPQVHQSDVFSPDTISGVWLIQRTNPIQVFFLWISSKSISPHYETDWSNFTTCI